MSKDANHEALKLAVSLAGGQAKLAKICDCSRANLNRQLRFGRGLPAKYVNVVEERLKIPRHVLRRDLYPPEREQ